MTELAELELIEVDDWLDESERHVCCAVCNNPIKGALATALCGTLMRVRRPVLLKCPPGTCDTCAELWDKPCPRCGADA